MSMAQPAPSLPIEELKALTRRMLVALGEDPDREGLVDTPQRVAESLSYLTEGYGVDPRQSEAGRKGRLVRARRRRPGDSPRHPFLQPLRAPPPSRLWSLPHRHAAEVGYRAA